MLCIEAHEDAMARERFIDRAADVRERGMDWDVGKSELELRIPIMQTPKHFWFPGDDNHPVLHIILAYHTRDLLLLSDILDIDQEHLCWTRGKEREHGVKQCHSASQRHVRMLVHTQHCALLVLEEGVVYRDPLEILREPHVYLYTTNGRLEGCSQCADAILAFSEPEASMADDAELRMCSVCAQNPPPCCRARELPHA
jgi:hypothetical protein